MRMGSIGVRPRLVPGGSAGLAALGPEQWVAGS
jgi:hypothetical protein